MGVIQTKTFMSGNSVAVRLPRELGVEAGVPVTLEQVGRSIEMRPVRNAQTDRDRLAAMIAARRAVDPVGEIEKREPFDFPERAGD